VQDFIPGQRWVSNAELQMGLGTVMKVEHRTVTLLFLATGDIRTYARQTAPLSRVRFVPGDTILDHEDHGLRVASVSEQDGLLTYHGIDEDGRTVRLEEGKLSNFIQLNRPGERLFSGQIDRDAWFELRYQSLQQLNRLAHSDLYGLIGCRTSLIPHQLYIAHEVANRYAPRVLLADEVGLGKTIEAGLILHHQLLTERASRVLILVPESLLHQWLVEMLRRFNLYFSIFDEERCQAITESSELDNPFHGEQLVLCTQEFLHSHAQRAQQASAGDWDLLVVDEAHHLQWSPQQASPGYRMVEQLATHTRGVLLLTATPEQLGKAGHFARLRLLDPDRFPDFDTFVEEEQRYEPIARAVEQLQKDAPLDDSTLNTLAGSLNETDNRPLLDRLQHTDTGSAENTAARQALVEHLLDRHGTGRVLFRNTRAAVQGFPQRQVTAYPLPLPAAYRELTQSGQAARQLTPELTWRAAQTGNDTTWTELDPRVEWLSHTLSDLKPHKVLVIAASAATVLDLAEHLRIRCGIHAAVFHEGMGLVERDRAAAFFADTDYGTQVLLCSEIGSEGRNFQFAHQLVLFDLPLNPDLLEQRIGRLDRIGQQAAIQIHVPYLEHSAQAVLFHWYHEGLSAFEHTCPAGHTVFTRLEDALHTALAHPEQDIEDLIEATRHAHQQLNADLQRGRDKLLEYNSCRPHIANDLKQRALEEDAHSTLPAYMEAVFDAFGVNSEEHSDGCQIIRPGDHMPGRFPGLPDDGMTITYARATALAYEDTQYLSWEHPLVTGAMDLVLGNETGNTALTSLRYRGTPPGSLLLECVFLLDSASSASLQSNRYLPATTIRVILDEQGHDHAGDLDHDFIQRHRETVPADTATRIVRAKEKELRDLVSACKAHAERQVPALLDGARQRTQDALQGEIDRLRALQLINPNVRDEEIEYLEQQHALLGKLLASATLRLDAVRVIVST